MSSHNPHITARQFGPLTGLSRDELNASAAAVINYLDGTFTPTVGWVDSVKASLGLSGSTGGPEEANSMPDDSEVLRAKYPNTARTLALFVGSMRSTEVTDKPDRNIILELLTLSRDRSAHSQVRSAADTLSRYGQKVREHKQDAQDRFSAKSGTTRG